jgi:hypothetical protein
VANNLKEDLYQTGWWDNWSQSAAVISEDVVSRARQTEFV